MEFANKNLTAPTTGDAHGDKGVHIGTCWMLSMIDCSHSMESSGLWTTIFMLMKVVCSMHGWNRYVNFLMDGCTANTLL